jgi:drug/metabolite transporter (DMT)-like permease
VLFLLGVLEIAYRRGKWLELVTGLMSGICFSQATVLMRSAHLLTAQGHGLYWLFLGGLASFGASLSGVYLQTRGLRHGRAVLIVTYDTLASCVASLVVGMLVLAEPFPTDAQGIFLRILSLVLIFVGIPLLAQQQARLQEAKG